MFPSDTSLPQVRGGIAADRTIGGLLVSFFLLLSSLNNLPAALHLGPTNLNVLITAGAVPAAFLAVFIRGRIEKNGLAPILFYLLFCSYCVAYLVPVSVNLQSFQNTTMYLAVGGLALLSFQVTAADPRFGGAVIRVVKRTTWVAVAFYLLLTAVGETGFNGLYNARSFALLAVLGSSIYVAEARAGVPFALFKAVALTLICLMTVSRSASACALLVLAAVWLDIGKFRSWIVTGVLAVTAILVFFAIAEYVPQFRASFGGGDEALQIAGFSIDTKGRLFWWTLIWNSFLNSPLFGHGPGSIQNFLIFNFQMAVAPHNDHLRLLHDTGLVGYGLWWAGVGGVLVSIFRGWKRIGGAGEEGVLLMATVLYSGAFIAVMFTDNVLIYYPVAFPFAILLGSSLSIAKRRVEMEQSVRRRTV